MSSDNVVYVGRPDLMPQGSLEPMPIETRYVVKMWSVIEEGRHRRYVLDSEGQEHCVSDEGVVSLW